MAYRRRGRSFKKRGFKKRSYKKGNKRRFVSRGGIRL